MDCWYATTQGFAAYQWLFKNYFLQNAHSSHCFLVKAAKRIIRVRKKQFEKPGIPKELVLHL
jgi:hypothetical protein